MKPDNDNTPCSTVAQRTSQTVAPLCPSAPISEEEAAAAFLAEMVDYAGGNELRWAHVTASYDAMRIEHAWPASCSQWAAKNIDGGGQTPVGGTS